MGEPDLDHNKVVRHINTKMLTFDNVPCAIEPRPLKKVCLRHSGDSEMFNILEEKGFCCVQGLLVQDDDKEVACFQ